MKKKVSSSKKKPSKKTVSKKTAGKSSKKAGVAPENSFLIRGGRLVTMDADERVIEADLLVVDGKIQKIAKRIPKTKAARVIEAKGKIVLPGFVQGHVHACHGLFRGFAEDVGHLSSLSEHLWPLEAMLDPDSMRAAARLSFAEALLAGTTSVLDMGSVHHTDILFEEAARFGLRYMGGKAIMDQAQGLLPGLRESTDEALMASNRLCEKYNGAEGGRLRYAYSPRFILSSSQTAFSESAKEAKKRGAWLHTHAAESSEESQLVEQRTGSLPFDFLDSQGFLNEKTIVAHGVFMSMKERRTLKESGAALAHCPSSNLKLGSGIARVSDLVRVGVPVLLGSGGAAVNNRLDILEEARLACLLQRHRGNPGAVSAREALRWITIEGARALGLQEVGALIEGYHADILLLDSQSPHLFSIAPDIYSQIVFSGRGSDIHSVWVDGRPLVEDHTLLVDSERKILAEADRAARLLVSKISKI